MNPDPEYSCTLIPQKPHLLRAEFMCVVTYDSGSVLDAIGACRSAHSIRRKGRRTLLFGMRMFEGFSRRLPFMTDGGIYGRSRP